MPNQEGHSQPQFDSIAILEEAENLVTQFKTVQLATLNREGNPEASYSPYIRRSGHYYIFISALASHTENILQHPTLSLFFVQNEDDAKNMFARKRLSIECFAKPLAREDEQWDGIIDALFDAHGPTVNVLRSLADFQLFELTPLSANYIKGFGQAFKLEGEKLNKVRQITGK